MSGEPDKIGLGQEPLAPEGKHDGMEVNATKTSNEGKKEKTIPEEIVELKKRLEILEQEIKILRGQRTAEPEDTKGSAIEMKKVYSDLQKSYEIEERRSTYSMTSFWYAYVNVLPKIVPQAVKKWPNELTGKENDLTNATIEILQKAVKALRESGYASNTNLIPGLFVQGKPIDLAINELEKDIGDILGVDVPGESSIRNAFDKTTDKINGVRVKMQVGDASIMLGYPTTEVMDGERLKSYKSPVGMAAWSLIGSTMTAYMERHLAKYLQK